jgi:hypothetical protein
VIRASHVGLALWNLNAGKEEYLDWD